MNVNGRGLVLSLVILILIVGSFLAGGVTGWVLSDSSGPLQPRIFAPNSPLPTPLTQQAQDDVPEKLREQFKAFWEVWALLEDNFYDSSKVDYQKMVYGAIKGLVDSVGDRYTFFSTPAQTGVELTHLQGEYEGIGAYIDQQDGFPVILGPVSEDTPAARAGLRKGDVVVAVDGKDVEGMLLEEVIAMIKGPAGSQVTIKIARPGEQNTFEVTVTRAKIEVASADGKMREDGLAYVKLSVFGETTAQELDNTLERLLKENPTGLILDLRGNGGGYVQAAQQVLGRFLRDGVATYQADQQGNRAALEIIGGGPQVYDLPMVVLIDGGSASASEIVAGALQDTKRAPLFGEQSFGKGSIQNVYNLPDGSSVRITIAHWLTPNGREIQGTGLTPDIVILLTPEDYDAGRDPQLDAAAAYLLGQPLPPAAATPTPVP